MFYIGHALNPLFLPGCNEDVALVHTAQPTRCATQNFSCHARSSVTYRPPEVVVGFAIVPAPKNCDRVRKFLTKLRN